MDNLFQNRTLIENIFKEDKKEVEVAGWVQNTRDLSKVKFLVLRDKSGIVQVTAVASKTPKEIFQDFEKIPRESVVYIKGNVIDSKQAPGGKEILPTKLEIISEASEPPIDTTEHSKTELPKRLDNRFLDTRRQNISAIFKIRSNIYKTIVNFLAEKNFIFINTPKITTIGLESGAECFDVDYFKKKAVLAQSPQFYKQMFVMGGFERVAEIGQVYRAEKSHTTRHLTEFTGVDFEMGFIDNENILMDVIEEMLKNLIKIIKEENKKELEILGINLEIPKKIPRISMGELKKVLKEKGKTLEENDDLDAESEKIIGKYIKDKYNEDFVFVTEYPFDVRPFYHMKQKDTKTKSFDLLYNGVEIATGAQREHRIEILEKQAKEKKVKLDKTYASIFKYGAIPHGGVGFGLDRITQNMLNLENVKEAILLPRDPERLTP
ncbi:MAG: aspartate--tRNA(Asn) ligase [Candidatus Pacearchaeota archaeon]|nr:aspartate--tRNA(Asn) ligase [Candidatus Pacearchaeota archaeon]